MCYAQLKENQTHTMHKIFQFLSENDLSNNDDFASVWAWNSYELTEFINKIDELDINEIENNNTFFSFSANEALSSGKNPCSSLDCRLESIKKLAQFAVLYSDNIFIYNPFEQYLLIEEWDDDLRQELQNDLIILDFLRPLINKKIIRFSKAMEFMCEECYSELFLKFDYIKKAIEETIINTTDYSVVQLFENIHIEASSSPELWGHETTCFDLENPKMFEKYLQNTDRYKLKKSEVKNLNLVSYQAEEILLDLIQQNANVTTNKNNYIFTNNYYPQIVSKINNYNPNFISPNEIVEGLAHVVPTIENTSIHNLISLREKDFESFLVYRDSIKRLISQTIEKNDFSNLSSAINDIVQPEINKMNLTVKNSKKLLSYKSSKELLISGGMISLGLFSGILPHDFGTVFGAIGGCKFVQTLLSQMIDINNPQYNISDQDYYFIWKMQNIERI